MSTQATGNERLDGWEAISKYLGWNSRTIIRWEKQRGLPVHRVPGGKRQPVYAYRHELDEWFSRTSSSATLIAPTIDADLLEQPLRGSDTTPQPWKAPLYGGVSTLLVLGAALAVTWYVSRQPVIQITALSQLTSNGTHKVGLVTDGKEIYFHEGEGGAGQLSAMSVAGGPIHRVPVPFPGPEPEDVSRDGRYLLVRSHTVNSDQDPLWVVPVSGDPPRQIEGLKCSAASWSPSGKWIACGFDDAVYLISFDGAKSHLLSRFDGMPKTLVWSRDERHLFVDLRSLASGPDSLWQVDFDNILQVAQVAPVHVPGSECCKQDFLARVGGSLISVMRDAKSDHLSLLSNSAWWRRQAWHSTAISTQFQVIGGIAANENGKELLLLTAMHPQAELVRYSPSIRSYTALLPGQSATYVDISRDMSSATYVDSQSFSLWVSRTDGSDRRQLSPPGMSVELPRWSPDGKLIAFMANTSHRTYRVFIVPASGREIKEASEGDDSQGAPTWSPDGRYLVYGGVLCQESHSCAIHRIDLQTGHVTTIPGSTGLQTARWSPDGRHIAALDGVQKQLRVFDFGREEWRTLAEGIDGNDVSWSSDSRFVYTKRSSSGKTEIVRVAIDGGSLQTALNLDSFGKSMGDPGIWFSVAPDNSVLISRWVNGAEIYSLSYEMR